MYNICKFEYNCRFIRAGQLYRLMYGKKISSCKKYNKCNVEIQTKSNQTILWTYITFDHITLSKSTIEEKAYGYLMSKIRGKYSEV